MFALLMHVGRPLVDRTAPVAVPQELFPFADPSLQQEWRGDHGVIISSADPSSRKDPRLITCRETGIVCAIWGQIHNRGDLAAQLGIAEDGSASIALSAYRKWGQDCCEKLVGEFALAIHDPRDGSVTAIRDAMGVRPLYYAMRDGELALATSIPALRGLAGGFSQIDPHWIARYISKLSMSCERTPYEGIAKVPPAHILRLDGDGLSLRRYFRFDPQSPKADARDPARLEAYREILEEVVRCRLDSPDPIGVETSGGIDSSTIVGFAPSMVKNPHQMLHGFGFVGSEKEPDAILGVSRFAGLRNNHLFLGGAGQEDAFARGIAVLGHPAEHGNSVAHIPFYKLARTLDVRSLLSGFGGDEGVTNYAINHRRDLIGSGQYKALWELLLGNPVSKALRFAKAVKKHGHYPEFAPNLLVGAKERLKQNILSADAGQAISIEQEVRNSARWHNEYETLNQFAIGMLGKPFVSTRTESCSLVAASYGIDYHWPLLDSRLIECWLSNPTIEKVHKHMGRYLHRRALKGLVPDHVRLQVSKYMGSSLASQGKELTRGEPDRFARLADGLHPSLAGLVDRERLLGVIDQCASSSGTENSLRQAERPLRAMSDLNDWLRQIDEGNSEKEAAA